MLSPIDCGERCAGERFDVRCRRFESPSEDFLFVA